MFTSMPFSPATQYPRRPSLEFGNPLQKRQFSSLGAGPGVMHGFASGLGQQVNLPQQAESQPVVEGIGGGSLMSSLRSGIQGLMGLLRGRSQQPSPSGQPGPSMGGMSMGVPMEFTTPGSYGREPRAGVGDQYTNVNNAIGMSQIANAMAGPQNLVDTVNGSYGMLRDSMGRLNDRIDQQNQLRLGKYAIDAKQKMFQQLASALLGAGAGGMAGTSGGIRDVNSPLQVGGGAVGTNISAAPLTLQSILAAQNAVQNPAAGADDTVRPVSDGARNELTSLLRGRLHSIAPDVDRALIPENAQFGLNIQGARANQFQNLSSLLAALQSDEISRQGANLRTLLGALQ